MALSTRIKVPLPERGIIVSHNPKRPYVYKVLRTYRNQKGQPTNDCKSIGRLDAASGMLIPNDYYWEAYPEGAVETLPRPDAVRSIGASFLLAKTLEGLGVSGMLEEALGKARAAGVETVASYMARRGNVIDGITDWQETSTLSGQVKVDPRAASRLFASISHADKMAFFRAWAARQDGPRYLAYDVTSFSTCAEGVGDAEWGHNRDGDRLPQINLGCYLDQATGLPVFYTTYPGSIVDKSHLASMMAYNKDLGVKHATFVMDRGFASTANIGHMRRHKLPYILGVESRHKTARQAVEQVRDAIAEMPNRLPGGVYAKAVKGVFWGQPATLHVFHDPVLREQRRSELTRAVEAEEDQLAQLAQLTAKQAKHYRRHFTITLAEDGSFAFERDWDKITAAGRDAGFFCVLTSTDLPSKEILAVYRRKDAIEKAFDDLKNHTDMKRLRTHSDETTAGKMFCAFISLIAVSQIQAKVGPVLKASKQSASKKDVLADMDKIKIVDASTGRRLINPATKLQRDILEALDLTEEGLKAHAAG
ncbi:MAG: transposase [Bifidobacteriaceae bacterium]|nr:transposase [Bifidobacteriaceae bacterium]